MILIGGLKQTFRERYVSKLKFVANKKTER